VLISNYKTAGKEKQERREPPLRRNQRKINARKTKQNKGNEKNKKYFHED
jgi:hypothetical protein